MTSEGIHRAVSADGTEIAGRVHGQGPPLVLFHGAPHAGDLGVDTEEGAGSTFSFWMPRYTPCEPVNEGG